MPEMMAPRYSIESESALELMTQPIATMMLPNATIIFAPFRGLRLSTIQPSTGVSQVSSAIKIAKASWIEAMSQPCALLIGLTNSVQPYCRLAIITMQMMAQMSCRQRVACAAEALDSTIVVVAAMVSVPV